MKDDVINSDREPRATYDKYSTDHKVATALAIPKYNKVKKTLLRAAGLDTPKLPTKVEDIVAKFL